jgi:hypothetical protein
MATKTHKTSKGIWVTLDTESGRTIKCVVPHKHVEYARSRYFMYSEAAACRNQTAGFLDFFVRRSLTGCGQQRGSLRALHLGEEVEDAFVHAFIGRFERGL